MKFRYWKISGMISFMSQVNRTLWEMLGDAYRNRDLPFIQRILNPGAYPEYRNEPGAVQSNQPRTIFDMVRNLDPSTHNMAWGTDDTGKHFVYPEIVQMQPGGWLQKLNQLDAWKHAERTGNRIGFTDPTQADAFSKNYKNLWDAMSRWQHK